MAKIVDKSQERYVDVVNRSNGTVSYRLPEINVYRLFQKNEKKHISEEELRSLNASAGGLTLIREYLFVDDEALRNELLGVVEPEYFYTKDEVTELLSNGSLDQLEDALNFAPDGVLDLIKDLACDLPCNDVAKRELIMKKTGFDVTKAIEINKLSREDDEAAAPAKPQRKAAAPAQTESSAPARKSTPVERKSKYTIVDKK